jgi:hypothetical protein
MDHPGDWWTIGFAVTLAAWGTGGTFYMKHRLLQPVVTGAHRAKHQAELARSTPGRMGKKLLLSKANRHIAANREYLVAAERWHNRVYAPVLVLLTVPTLVLAAWGVVR